MSVSKTTGSIVLSKCSAEQQDKYTYDNSNYDILDAAISSIQSDVGSGSTTKYVKTPLEFISALDTSKSTVTFGGISSANSYVSETINVIVVQADIDMSNLSSTHFGTGVDEYYMIPSDDIVEIRSEGGRIVTCTNFGIRIDDPATGKRTLKIANINFTNLGNTLTTLAINQVSETGIQADVTYTRLKGSIATPVNFGLTSGLDGNCSFSNIFIDGFDDGFTVIEGMFNFNNLQFKMYIGDISNTNTLMNAVFNGSNISLIYDLDETKTTLGVTMFELGATLSNIIVLNGSIKQLTSTNLFNATNINCEIHGENRNSVYYSSNIAIVDVRATGTTNYLIMGQVINSEITGSSVGYKCFWGLIGNSSAPSGSLNSGGKGGSNSWNNQQVTTTGTTVTVGINDIFNLGDTTSNVIAYTLPPVADVHTDTVYYIADSGGNANTNNITINTDGAETINGSASYTISSDYGKIGILSNGTNWFIVS